MTLAHQDQAKEINAALASGELETTAGTVSFVDLWDIFTDARGNQILGYFFLNLRGNFVHLNALGYAAWGAAITPFLRLPKDAQSYLTQRFRSVFSRIHPPTTEQSHSSA